MAGPTSDSTWLTADAEFFSADNNQVPQIGQVSLIGYQSFLYSIAGIPSYQLPPQSGVIAITLAVAQEIVADILGSASGVMYAFAVYNLAADRLVNYAPDQESQTFFADMRKKYLINNPAVGVVSASSDQGSSTSLLNPEQMKNMTLMDLQTLKTPWGREYMGIAQSIGTLWGLS